jgi:hypothetical protein
VADGRFLDALVVTGNFLCGDGGYEHPSLPPCNQELQLRRRRTHTIVWWVVQAAAMDNVSLVHDDGFYPHRDVTTV